MNALTNILAGVVMTLVLFLFVFPAGNVAAAGAMPEFSLDAVNTDREITSSNYRGKVVLVNFWATWCPPCRKEIPSLIDLQEKYWDRGFSVIGISVDEGGKRIVRKFSDRMQINYPVIMDKKGLAKSFGAGMGIPVTFLVDPDGNIVRKYAGYVSHEELEGDILKLIN